jgi:hypothetical protein
MIAQLLRNQNHAGLKRKGRLLQEALVSSGELFATSDWDATSGRKQIISVGPFRI